MLQKQKLLCTSFRWLAGPTPGSAPLQLAYNGFKPISSTSRLHKRANLRLPCCEPLVEPCG